MLRYETQRHIEATPQAVWDVLTDTRRLVGGGFGITALDGRLAAGERVSLAAEVSGDRRFKLLVAEFDPPRRMVWRGGMPLGLFTGTRTFSLAPADGGTDFAMDEVFTGLMAGLIGKSMPDLTPTFEQFAEALAKHAETGGA